MANYQLLKADIDKKVYQNGHQEITGENLNYVLNQMVTTLGAEYQFAGVATKDTNPGTPDAKVFYIANGKGTYTNFGGINVTEDEVVVLYWDTAWHKVATGIASQAKLTELGHKVDDFGKIEETLQLQLVLGAIMEFSTLTELELNEGEYWMGTLPAGTYKISGYSINANYPCLAKKVGGSFEREIYPGDAQEVSNYEITFDSDTEVIINGRQDVGLIVVKINLPVTFQDIYDKVSSLSGIVEDTTPMRIKTRKYTDAQGRDCLIYDIFKRFNNSYDVCYSFGNKYNTPNANFDFYGISLYNRADQLGDGTLVSEHFAAQTDSILPIIVAATNNADGDFPTSTDLYTGGFHGYNNASTSTTKPTSRTISQKVYADGFEVVDGTDRFCQKVKMVVVTNVQGCNTEKSDGSGREIMEQTIVVSVDSLNTRVNVQWKALEDVTIYSLHGFAISAPSCNGRFIGSKTDRGLYPIGTVKRTTSIPDAIRAILSNGHYLDIRLNRMLDLGRYGYNDEVDSYKATITTANKIYTLMLSEQMPMSQNDVVQYEADYQFV